MHRQVTNSFLALTIFTLLAGGCDNQENKTADDSQEAGMHSDSPSASQEDECKAIRQLYATYNAANVANDGEAAVACLASSNIEKYQEFCDLAVSGTEVAIRALPFYERMTILILRLRIDAESFKTMDGKGILRRMIDENWNKNAGSKGVELDQITFRGFTATATIKLDGESSEPEADQTVYVFVKEEGQWRLDFLSTAHSASFAFEYAVQKAREKGLTEDEFMFLVLKSATGLPVDEGIWKPRE